MPHHRFYPQNATTSYIYIYKMSFYIYFILCFTPLLLSWQDPVTLSHVES